MGFLQLLKVQVSREMGSHTGNDKTLPPLHTAHLWGKSCLSMDHLSRRFGDRESNAEWGWILWGNRTSCPKFEEHCLSGCVSLRQVPLLGASVGR